MILTLIKAFILGAHPADIRRVLLEKGYTEDQALLIFVLASEYAKETGIIRFTGEGKGYELTDYFRKRLESGPAGIPMPASPLN